MNHVCRGDTKSIVQCLQKQQSFTLDALASAFRLRQNNGHGLSFLTEDFNVSLDSLSAVTKAGTARIPDLLYQICHDKTVVHVDSTPLQNLAKRMLRVCRASLDYIIQTIPLTIARQRLEELHHIQKVLLNRYQHSQNVQGINALSDFQKRKWPTIEMKLSLLVFAALNPGIGSRRTMDLCKRCGLLPKKSKGEYT